MVIIEYTDQGQPISEFHLDQWVETVKKYAGRHKILAVSTSTAITAVRLAICRQQIDHDKVVFRYNGRDFKANTYGAIHNWPAGFADIDAKLAQEILTLATKRKKQAGHPAKQQAN